jgi:hypothetical protein
VANASAPIRTAPGEARPTKRRRPALVDPAHFLVATRDSGYKTTALAVAELVDNSLQAGAARVSVDVVAGKDPGYPLELRVTDDGSGMDPSVLSLALTFGGSSRFDDRSSLGRYGMGLPNGALSRARRVEVYSWRDGVVASCYLDVDEFVEQRRRSLPPVVEIDRPSFVPRTPHGTVVRLVRCDRLEYRRASTLAQRLATELGRIYRVFLDDRLELVINGEPVPPTDPLFLDGRGRAAGARQFGDVLRYRLSVGRSEGTVDVRFSELPIERWHVLPADEKRHLGITNSPPVSVLRAGREIDRGWFFMGAKRRENYDDWWRCEVRFDPALDELFGITHSKQAIAPTQELLDALTPDLEPIARALNSRVRQRFELVKVAAPLSEAERQAARAHPLLPMLPSRGHRLAPELEELLELLGKEMVEGRPYRIAVSDLPTTAVFEATVRRGGLVVALNSRHPLYRDLYGPLATSDAPRDQEVATRIALTVVAAARAELLGARRSNHDEARLFRQAWSDVLATFLNA